MEDVSLAMNRGCDLCRQRKVRCDRIKPACLRCRRMSVVCPGYSERPLRIIIAADQVERSDRPGSQVSSSRTSPVEETRELHSTAEFDSNLGSASVIGDPQHLLTYFKADPFSSLPMDLSARDGEMVFNFLTTWDDLFPGRNINQDIYYSLGLRGSLAFQTCIVMPASLLDGRRRNDQMYGLLNINKTLSIIRQRIEQHRANLDVELLVSIAKLAQQYNHMSVMQNTFFQVADPIKHWLAAVSILRNSGGPSSLQPNSKEAIHYNWIDLMMLPPSTVDEHHRYCSWPIQTETTDTVVYHLDRLCDLLDHINRARALFQSRCIQTVAESANLTPIAQALQATFSNGDLTKFRNATHLQAYSLYTILLHIHFAISLCIENETPLELYFEHLESIFNDNGQARQPCLCISAFEMLRFDLGILDRSKTEARGFSSAFHHPSSVANVWTLVGMQRTMKMLSLQAVERVFLALASILEFGQRSSLFGVNEPLTSSSWKDYLMTDLFETKSPAKFTITVPWDMCAWGGPYRHSITTESRSLRELGRATPVASSSSADG